MAVFILVGMSSAFGLQSIQFDIKIVLKRKVVWAAAIRDTVGTGGAAGGKAGDQAEGERAG